MDKATGTDMIVFDTPFDEMDADAQQAEHEAKLREACSAIIDRLNAMATNAVWKRTQIEQRWLEDIRAYQGKYEPEIEEMLAKARAAGTPRSRAFVKIARTKTDSWEARLADLLFPADDRNWGVGPTPVPELAREAEIARDEAEKADADAQAKTEEANQLAQSGADQAAIDAVLTEASALGAESMIFKEAARKAQLTMEEAKRRAEAMQREIDDQLTECGYPKRARDIIRDACRLGTGVMKGPLVANRPRRRWAQDETNNYSLKSEPDPRPECRRVDPWHFFPDPDATQMDDCPWTLERHLPTRKALRDMAKTLGFQKEAVKQILREGPGYGAATDLDYLNQLRDITNEGEAITGRYVMWEYNGPLEADEICTLLTSVGMVEEAHEFMENDDPLNEHMVTIYFCNGMLLKIAEQYPLDSGDSLYSVFSFSPGEASVMGGRGVPNLMLDSLKALNAAWRMMLDNAALSVAPQVLVDKRQFEPEDGSWTMTPGKVWVRVGQEVPHTKQPPFETFNIPINQAQIAGIIELALKFIDEETSLPMIAQGEQGSHTTQTMGGMTMLFNSANVVFRRVVKNWDDDITTPMIRRFYDYNMQFSTKAEIKGDMQCEARGTSVLLVREVQSQNLMVIATNWTGHPILGAAVKAYGVLRMTVQSLGINPDDVLESEEDFKRNMKAMQEGTGEASAEMIRAETSIKTAEINAKSREVDGQVNLQIANIRKETALIELASKENMTVEQLKVRLAEKQIDVDSKERTLAVEHALQAADRKAAEQMGDPAPKQGGGRL